MKDHHNDLFRGGPNWHLNACVGRNGCPADFYKLASGFFDAGKRLAESIFADSFMVDRLVYPVVMVYRHGVELYLKHLVGGLRRFCTNPKPLVESHNLVSNWNLVRSYLEEHSESESDAEMIEAAEKTILDLVAIDPTGAAFRYPKAKGPQGERFLQNLTQINIEIFSIQMDELGKSFEAWSTMASVLWDMEMELAENMEYFGGE